jgi:hypothetical protein
LDCLRAISRRSAAPLVGVQIYGLVAVHTDSCISDYGTLSTDAQSCDLLWWRNCCASCMSAPEALQLVISVLLTADPEACTLSTASAAADDNGDELLPAVSGGDASLLQPHLPTLQHNDSIHGRRPSSALLLLECLSPAVRGDGLVGTLSNDVCLHPTLANLRLQGTTLHWLRVHTAQSAGSLATS